MITVGGFLDIISKDRSWTAGEDFGNEGDVLLRKNCARILHRFLQKVKNEPDEIYDLPSSSDLRDIYDCRICAPHIVQVTAKGIMLPQTTGCLMLFCGDKEVREDEAVEYVKRLENRNARQKLSVELQ